MKTLSFLLLSIFSVAALSCGPVYPNYGVKNFDFNRIQVELIKTSEENPLPLCGEEEILMLLDRLDCPGGRRLFKDMKEAIAREDAEYHSTYFPKQRVRRFIGFCHEKQYTLFINMDACDDPRRFEPILMDEE